MVSRADTLEKMFGRRMVSCLGYMLLLLALLIILALAWPRLFPEETKENHPLLKKGNRSP
ncbi:MAG: hypothetical protein V1899_10690 [Planctomycetota bacterium]